MMFGLILDGFANSRDLGLADAGREISFLPFEPSPGTFVHPSRRIGLQDLRSFGDPEHGFDIEQCMRMVRDSPDGNRIHPVAACDSSHVRPQLRLNLLRDGLETAFGAEDDMNVMADIRIGHSVPSLMGLGSSVHSTRHYRAGLALSRPSGTQDTTTQKQPPEC